MLKKEAAGWEGPVAETCVFSLLKDIFITYVRVVVHATPAAVMVRMIVVTTVAPGQESPVVMVVVVTMVAVVTIYRAYSWLFTI
jgi:hypothetical protein